MPSRVKPFIANGVEYKSMVAFYKTFHPDEENPLKKDIDRFAYHNSPEFREQKNKAYRILYNKKRNGNVRKYVKFSDLIEVIPSEIKV